jgi:hypothetical protein
MEAYLRRGIRHVGIRARSEVLGGKKRAKGKKKKKGSGEQMMKRIGFVIWKMGWGTIDVVVTRLWEGGRLTHVEVILGRCVGRGEGAIRVWIRYCVTACGWMGWLHYLVTGFDGGV